MIDDSRPDSYTQNITIIRIEDFTASSVILRASLFYCTFDFSFSAQFCYTPLPRSFSACFHTFLRLSQQNRTTAHLTTRFIVLIRLIAESEKTIHLYQRIVSHHQSSNPSQTGFPVYFSGCSSPRSTRSAASHIASCSNSPG